MLSQETANHLIQLEKLPADKEIYSFPTFGGSITILLESRDGREKFQLDISRQRLNLKKVKYQNRYNQTEVLVRLDLGGAPHRNPDGEEIACPHLHLYREGFGDKWAQPVPANLVDPTDIMKTLSNFYTYCRIVEAPELQMGLT